MVKFGVTTDIHHCDADTIASLDPNGFYLWDIFSPTGPNQDVQAQNRWIDDALTRFGDFIDAMEALGDIDFCIDGGDKLDSQTGLTNADENNRGPASGKEAEFESDIRDALDVLVAKSKDYSGDMYWVLGNHDFNRFYFIAGGQGDDNMANYDAALAENMGTKDWFMTEHYQVGITEDTSPNKTYAFEKNGIYFLIIFAQTGGNAWTQDYIDDINTQLSTINLPIVVFTHAHLWTAPGDRAYIQMGGPTKEVTDAMVAMFNTHNVQVVIQGHDHRAVRGLVTQEGDIAVVSLAGGVLGPDNGNNPDTDFSAYYTIEVIPNAVVGTNRMRANVEITGFKDLGLSKLFAKYAIVT